MANRKPNSYIINEANGDRHAGAFKTYEAAVKAMNRYGDEDMERCQPAIGMPCKSLWTPTFWQSRSTRAGEPVEQQTIG